MVPKAVLTLVRYEEFLARPEYAHAASETARSAAFPSPLECLGTRKLYTQIRQTERR